MVKAIPIVLLFISLSFSITIFQYPGTNLMSFIGKQSYGFVSDKLKEVMYTLKIKKLNPVTIFEANSVYEFSKITGEEYSIGGVYQDGFIITQPFKVLKEKGVLKKILTHELLHYILHQKYKLPKWMEEGYIEYTLNDNPNDLQGYHRTYLIKFLKEVIDEQKSIVNLFNNYIRF